MAKTPRKRGANASSDFSPDAEIKKLWTAIPPQEWLSLLQELAPDGQWALKGQSQIVGCCPYHDENTPSFKLSIHKGMGKCFGACEKYVYNPVNLVAKLRTCSTQEALIFLHGRFGLEGIIKNIDTLNHYNQLQEMKKAAAIAMNALMSEVIRDNPDHLKYCRPALDYIVKHRKIPMESLPNLPIGLLGKPEHLKAYIQDASLHPMFDEYFAKYANSTYWGSIMFHYNDTPGSISRFKIRLIDAKFLKTLKNYDDISETDAGKCVQKELFYLDDQYNKGLGTTGVFGLYKYQRMIGQNDTNAYVTEGEFDVLSVMAAQDMNGSSDFILLGAGGKGTPDLGFLREYGIKSLWLVQDQVWKNGHDWVKTILGTKANFTLTGTVRPLMMKIFQWPAALQGGDLDEAVKLNGYPAVFEYIFKDRNSYFLNSVPWATQQCDEEISKIETEYDHVLSEMDISSETHQIQISNLRDERHGKIKDAILKWFRYIHDPSDKVSFTQKYAVERGVDVSQMSSVSSALYALNTAEGNVQKVKDALNEHLEMAYYEQCSSGARYWMWAKQREELVPILMTEKQLYEVISQYTGKDFISWFDNLLGDSPLYNEGLDDLPPIARELKKRKNAKVILERTMESLSSQPRNVNDLELLSQGVHYHDLPASLRQQNYIYFVNGKKIFRGKYLPTGEIEWGTLGSVVDGPLLFTNLTATRKWSFVDDVTDLYSANQIDLKKVYQKLRTILDAWKFQHHDIVAPYLAAYIMSMTCMRAIGDVNITYVTGQKESGKSSLVQGLLGGYKTHLLKIPSMIEASVQAFNASAAAMYQSMDGVSHPYIIDEAEVSEGHNTSHDDKIKEIIRLLYQMHQGGVKVDRGSASGVNKEYFIKMPVVMAAINIPTDTTFLSRVFIINTEHDPGRQDPSEYIYSKFSEDELVTLRKENSLGLLPHIPEIIHRRSLLKQKLSLLTGKVAHVSNRFLDSILTPLAVYDFIGEDAEDLYRRILTGYKNQLESIHGAQNQSELLNACLYTNSIKITTEDNIQDYVSAKHLILRGEYNILNNNGSGVYYVEPLDAIVVVWRQAKYGILSRSNFARTEDGALRERAAKNPFVYQEVTPAMAEVIKHELNLRDVRSASEYTVLSVEYLRDKSEVTLGGLVPKEAVVDTSPALELNSDAGVGADICI
jgi:hypothetical protein